MLQKMTSMISIILSVVLLSTACNIPGGGSGDAGGGQLTSIRDLSGTWSGLLHDQRQDYDWTLTIVLFHGEGATELSGEFTSSNADATFVSSGTLTGTFDGTNLRLLDDDGAHYWGVVSGETFTGSAAWDCYDCPDAAWGTFALTRGVISGNQPPLTGGDQSAPAGNLVEIVGFSPPLAEGLSMTTSQITLDVHFILTGVDGSLQVIFERFHDAACTQRGYDPNNNSTLESYAQDVTAGEHTISLTYVTPPMDIEYVGIGIRLWSVGQTSVLVENPYFWCYRVNPP